MNALIGKKHVFVCQRTGRGKSLCYQAFTTATGVENSIVLVVSPLISIMEEQVKQLNDIGIPSIMLGKDGDLDKEAQTGKYAYIYASPEVVVAKPEWRLTLKSPLFQERLALIVADEAHLIVQCK